MTVGYQCSICRERLYPADVATHLEWHSRNESGEPDWPVSVTFRRVRIAEDDPGDTAEPHD